MQHTPMFPAPSAYKTAIQCPFAEQWLILLLIFSRLKPETSATPGIPRSIKFEGNNDTRVHPRNITILAYPSFIRFKVP